MAVVVIMPKQGQSVESCIINEIKMKKGDAVKKGDILFTYETDKASFEEESPADGVVLECFYNEGDEVPVLQNMMVIGQPGEEIPLNPPIGGSQDAKTASEISKGEPNKAKKHQIEANVNIIEDAIQKVPLGGFRGLSPRARFIADEEALDISHITGSGPNGRIIEKDIAAALNNRGKLTPLAKKVVAGENLQPQGAGTGLAGMIRAVDLSCGAAGVITGVDYEDRKLSNIRKIIAKTMHASLQNSAQLTHHLGADARRMLELRKQAKTAFETGKLTTNITLNDMVCFAVIRALKKFPNVNSHFLGDSMRLFNKVHLGLAVDTDRGLMVPVVRNADELSIIELAIRFKELAVDCRKGSVNPEILLSEAGTFTVSNLGNYGVEMFTPVINLPQSAILGVNTIVPRPKDLDDGVYAFVPYMGLSLTYDHRALDGGEATRFLKQIAVEIETLELIF